MGAIPPTKYARTPDGLDLAYQVIDGGPADLVCVWPYVSAIEVLWEWPSGRRFLEGLASFARVVQFDGRGTGASARPAHPPALEVRMADLEVILDSAGLDRAALLAMGDGAAVAGMFAAACPERVSSLAMYYPMVRTAWAEDFPWGVTAERAAAFHSRVKEEWGSEEASAEFLTEAHGDLGPLTGDPNFVRLVARHQRRSVTPAEFEAFDHVWMETDVRDVLPSIQAPTVVLHRAAEEGERGMYEAVERAIPGATRVELPGTEFIPFIGDSDAVVDAVARHLGVERPPAVYDRVLASVLFTDIVGSTEHAAELGDARWREVIVEHETRAREVLDRYGGLFEHTTGDGLMARFDGPARAVRCAREMASSLDGLDIRIRAGVHTGEIELTEAGAHGLAVHLAARVAALAEPDEVWVSSTVKDLTAGSGLVFEDRGEHELKGVPDRWHLYRVIGS